MELTDDERAILDGRRGPTWQKILATVVAYGDAFGADRLVEITGAPHFVMSFGTGFTRPYLALVESLVAEGLTVARPFTVDPRPFDFAGTPTGWLSRLVFRVVYSQQSSYEARLRQLGLRDPDAFSCACYLPEVGNVPRAGDVLAWSESSAVAFANSALGARTNRNSGGIDLLCNVAGRTPRFGLLTDEGRRPTRRIEIRTRALPHPQLLGDAVGRLVQDEVPWLAGLERHLDPGRTAELRDYLKDLGAAAAASGAVGLFHAEGLTPEARADAALRPPAGCPTDTIDDDGLARRSSELAGVAGRGRRPTQCFIGCPHLSLEQLRLWTERLAVGLSRRRRRKPAVETLLCTAPAVRSALLADAAAAGRLRESGARVTTLCPLMYLANPLLRSDDVVTSSCKLRTYTAARFLPDDELLALLLDGGRS